MKNFFLLLVINLLSISFTKAQFLIFEDTKITITPYISGPNLTGKIMADVARKKGFDNLSHSSIPILGFKIEQIRRNGVGFTFEANYTYAKAGFKIPDLTRNAEFKATFPQFRIMYGNSYHFGNSYKFDWYLGYHLGWHSGSYNIKGKNTISYTVSQYDPLYFNLLDYKDYISDKFALVDLPILFRANIGTNISLTNRIGLNLEIGAAGGGLIKAGTTINLFDFD